MSLQILQFVRAKRGPRSGWVYGYVSDVGQPIKGVAEWEWIEVRYHTGIKPTTELFALNQVQAISDETFDIKTEGQTALHSRYWDDKEKADKERAPKMPKRPNLRAITVRESRTSGPYGYDLRMQTDHKPLGVFLVPVSYDYYVDSRGLDHDQWLASMRKRFTFVPSTKRGDLVTIHRGKD